MSKGIGNVEYVRQGSEVTMQGQGALNWGYLYEVSTVKNPKWNIGDRVVTPDGRSFRYAKSGAACVAGQGASFYGRTAVSYVVFPAQVAPGPTIWGMTDSAGKVGDNALTVTVAITDGAAGTGVIAEDELRGGYAVIYGVVADNADIQQRGIIGNTAVAAGGGTMTLFLDASLVKTVTTSFAIEILPNPYADLRTNLGNEEGYMGIAGLPAAYVSAASMYFWVQTWGPVWVPAGGGTPGSVAAERQMVFSACGALRAHSAAYATTKQYQHAGFIMQRDSSGSGGPPFIMLQISP